MQGTALGWNAGAGNLGVGIMQAVVPVVIYGGALAVRGGDSQTYTDGGTVTEIWLQNAGYIWVPFILLATLAAWFGMHNIRVVRATFAEQLVIFRRRHAWLLAWLYAGTFGSFIGFAAAFPSLLSSQFPHSGAVKYAFLGPLLGALVRPFGGWLADRIGGARVTLVNFAVMLLAALGILAFLPSESGSDELTWFFALFMLLFVATGIGNGSVFRIVPTVFLMLHRRAVRTKDPAALEQAERDGEIEASVALGFTAAIAALGLFVTPATIGVSIDLTGSAHAGMLIVVVFYLSCLLTTWWWYCRKGAEIHCE
jgi:NNP family nitrate/nitrite transporter-like MFS transporter